MTGDMQRRNIGQSEPAENPSEGEGSPKKTPRGTGERSTRPRRLTLEEGRVGQVLNGRYRLLELIGKGGMAAVYKAEHLGMPLPVAVKMLLPDIEEDELMVERFVREAKTSGRATHPHVVQLMDYGQAEDNSRYIVVEYLDGQSLAQLLKKEEQLSVERVVHIASQICEALDDSHRKNIIHRDLKPSNIMLIQQDDKDDFVKVVDFGLAKINGGDSQRLTQTGELFGSPIYMSPEQCRGLPLDGRSDIYSLGIMMYEALAGKAPLVGDNIVATITKHLHESPQSFKTVRADLYVPARLEAVILKALAKDPCDRFATMGEFREALKVAVPGPLDAVGLRKLNSYMLPGMLNSLSERTSLLIALSMVVMIIVVCATAAVTTFLKSRHHSTAVQVRSNHSAMEKPVDVSPPGAGITEPQQEKTIRRQSILHISLPALQLMSRLQSLQFRPPNLLRTNQKLTGLSPNHRPGRNRLYLRAAPLMVARLESSSLELIPSIPAARSIIVHVTEMR